MKKSKAKLIPRLFHRLVSRRFYLLFLMLSLSGSILEYTAKAGGKVAPIEATEKNANHEITGAADELPKVRSRTGMGFFENLRTKYHNRVVKLAIANFYINKNPQDKQAALQAASQEYKNQKKVLEEKEKNYQSETNKSGEELRAIRRQNAVLHKKNKARFDHQKMMSKSADYQNLKGQKEQVKDEIDKILEEQTKSRGGIEPSTYSKVTSRLFKAQIIQHNIDILRLSEDDPERIKLMNERDQFNAYLDAKKDYSEKAAIYNEVSHKKSQDPSFEKSKEYQDAVTNWKKADERLNLFIAKPEIGNRILRFQGQIRAKWYDEGYQEKNNKYRIQNKY